MSNFNGDKEKVIVGIDLSKSATAIAVVWNKRLIESHLWLYGYKNKYNENFAKEMNVNVYSVEDNKEIEENPDLLLPVFHGWSEAAIRIISERYKKIEVRLEGYAFGLKSRAVSTISEFGSILKLNLIFYKLDYTVIPPSVVKKKITGFGNADKGAVALSVYKKLKLDLFPLGKAAEDLFDAIALTLIKLD